jgi:glycosyltransferase involved in cell wall biosynthesis
MKILSICPAHLKAYKIGGPIATVASMNKGLINSDESIMIDVLSTSYGLGDDKDVTFHQWEIVDELTRYRVKYFKYYGYGNLTFSPRLYMEAKKIIQEYDLIILQGVWNFPLFSIAYLANKYNVPYIVVPRGTLYKETWEMKSKWYKDILYRVTVRNMLQNASRIQFTTIDEQKNVLAYLGLDLKYYIVPNSIDLSKYDKLPERNEFLHQHPSLCDKKVILFFGRITRKKGLDILVESLKILKDKRDDFILLIAGPDSEGYWSTIEKQILECGLTDNVLYVGMLEGEDKFRVLVDSDIFVLSSYSENFGMSVIEAMAAGLPVIISNKVGIYNEVQKEEAGIVTTLDAGEIAQSIDMLLSDDHKRKNFSEKGRQFVRDYYEIDHVNKQLLLEIKKITDEHR